MYGFFFSGNISIGPAAAGLVPMPVQRQACAINDNPEGNDCNDDREANVCNGWHGAGFGVQC